jgi:hypothetical protein
MADPERRTIVANGVDQLGDGGRTPVRQVEGEHATQLDPSKVGRIHCRNVARRYDIDQESRRGGHMGHRLSERRV